MPVLPSRVRVLLSIRSITSVTWGRETRPEVKPLLRRALKRQSDTNTVPGRRYVADLHLHMSTRGLKDVRPKNGVSDRAT